MRSRAQSFLDAAPPGVRAALGPGPGLEAALDAAWAAARGAHPSLELSEGAFFTHLAQRLPAAEPLAALESLHAVDLYLACACMAGARGALDEFERAVLAPLARPLERLAGANADEVRQRLRERLFVGASPSIGQYSGRGSLREWVRAAATRLAIDLHRKDQGAPLPEQSIWDRLPLEGVDLELGLIKAEHQEKFGEAFAHTLSQLTARERTLLRMHLLDGLSFEEIGAFYRVNRSTACRWVAAARREVLKGTQRYLSDRLGLTRSEMASVLRGVRSQVDLRISGYLARSPPA